MLKTAGMSKDIEKWLKLINAEGVGPVTFKKILNKCGTIDKALRASVKELSEIEGIGFKTAETIVRTRDKFDAATELESAEKLGVQIITIEDKKYPVLLKSIYDPPPVLYIKGALSKADNLAIAIVGSRRCSLYGQEQASRLAHLLSFAGFTICSGMARGIDSSAHQGAIAGGGRTIAVLGCGLSHIYPPENRKLFEQISCSGACVSELPLQTGPLAENFPARNRIIAGLSLGTIVIEAGLNSGALLTAQSACEYEREVMAVPGKIDSPLSRGTHQLIKQGAKLIESVADVTDALGYIGEEVKEQVVNAARRAEAKVGATLFDVGQFNLSDSERTIYECLNNEPIHIEQIVADTGFQAGNISSSLISLQLKGAVKQLPGSFYIRR
jgi:DNA processing protein